MSAKFLLVCNAISLDVADESFRLQPADQAQDKAVKRLKAEEEEVDISDVSADNSTQWN